MNREIEVFDGRRLLGIVRELPSGMFVAIIDEQVLGPHNTCRQATDALLELVRVGGVR